MSNRDRHSEEASTSTLPRFLDGEKELIKMCSFLYDITASMDERLFLDILEESNTKSYKHPPFLPNRLFPCIITISCLIFHFSVENKQNPESFFKKTVDWVSVYDENRRCWMEKWWSKVYRLGKERNVSKRKLKEKH